MNYSTSSVHSSLIFFQYARVLKALGLLDFTSKEAEKILLTMPLMQAISIVQF